MKRSFAEYAAYLSITLGIALFSAYAKADTVILNDKPSATITAGDASKSKTPVFECVKSKDGSRANPIKVPGSTSVWTRDPGKGIENAGEVLGSGKTVYICKSKLKDNGTGRMKAVAL